MLNRPAKFKTPGERKQAMRRSKGGKPPKPFATPAESNTQAEYKSRFFSSIINSSYGILALLTLNKITSVEATPSNVFNFMMNNSSSIFSLIKSNLNFTSEEIQNLDGILNNINCNNSSGFLGTDALLSVINNITDYDIRETALQLCEQNATLIYAFQNNMTELANETASCVIDSINQLFNCISNNSSNDSGMVPFIIIMSIVGLCMASVFSLGLCTFNNLWPTICDFLRKVCCDVPSEAWSGYYEHNVLPARYTRNARSFHRILANVTDLPPQVVDIIAAYHDEKVAEKSHALVYSRGPASGSTKGIFSKKPSAIAPSDAKEMIEMDEIKVDP